ncbi:MAG: hypothetical protein HQM07_04770 [Zetaproteobacteria bacterium]|nr:hypothetical protein [Zetaproteobacteria bacterium]
MSIKPEYYVFIIGFLLVLGVVVSAVSMGDSTSLDEPVPATLADGAASEKIAGMQPSAAVANNNGQQQPLQQGMVPFEVAPMLRYRGQVDRIVVRGAGTEWAQEHAFVTSGAGTFEISLAPLWFLEHMGCPVKVGDSIQGMAFNFNEMNPLDTFVYAKNVKVNGTTCSLRNDEGLALWSNRLVLN